MGIDAFLQQPGYNYLPERPGYHYVPDYYGRSAHKHIDLRSLPGFGILASEVIQQGRTLLYYDRLHVIYQALAGLKAIAEPRFDCVNLAEIGVYKGGTSYFIASVVEELGFHAAKHYCFDTFEGFAEEDIDLRTDGTQKPGKLSDTQFASVKAYLRRFNNLTLYKGRFQDTCNQVASRQFHFIHLDVDIYKPTLFSLNFFDERLVTGGVIVIDDYGFRTCPGVKQAVDEFKSTRNNYFSLHVLTGQCVLVKMGKSMLEKPVLEIMGMTAGV
jgi:hypothetical protein